MMTLHAQESSHHTNTFGLSGRRHLIGLLVLVGIFLGGVNLTSAQTLSPSSLTFTAVAGGGPPASQSLALNPAQTNRTRTWTLSTSVPWLWVTPDSGDILHETDPLTAYVLTTSGLSAGIHTATIDIVLRDSNGNVRTTSTSVTLNLTSSGGGSSSPTMALSPTSLSFSGSAGGSVPPSQTISLTNPGGGTLSTNWASSESWLILSASSRSTTTETDTVNVTANTSGLSAGTYVGAITISGNASNNPQQIPVTLTVTSGGGGASAGLSVSPTSLTFTAPVGSQDAMTQTINISNSGGGTLSWTATDPVDWVVKNVDGGTGNGSLQVTVYPSYFGGAAGTYTSSVTITAPGASGSPKTIPVTLTIGSSSSSGGSTGGGSTGGGSTGGGSTGGGTTGGNTTPTLGVSPTSLTFNIPSGSLTAATQYLNISNTGGGTLTWTATDPVDWLVKDVDGGTGNGSLQITVYPHVFGGTNGTYNTSVTITGAGANGSPKTIPVTMNIGGTGGSTGGGGTASVTLTWSANSESDLQGYRVYYGTSNGNYTTNVDVGNVTSYTVNGLSTGFTYYFAIKAMDTSGNLSGYSNQVTATR